jgi:hypothetical protein
MAEAPKSRVAGKGQVTQPDEKQRDPNEKQRDPNERTQ